MSSSDFVLKVFDLSIRDCMRQPVTVSPEEPASGLIYTMVGNDIGAVIVVENKVPVGIVTEKDILERVILFNKNMYTTKAKDFMSKPIITIEADHMIKDALALMRKYQIRRLAVTEKSTLIGIVTERRLCSAFLNQVY